MLELELNTKKSRLYKQCYSYTQICVSYAFMLPVATAPNAIVYAASSMKTSDMMRTGFFMNIICIITTWYKKIHLFSNFQLSSPSPF